jgi:chorismate mutase
VTVRELIRQMQTEIRDATDLQPDRASELLNRLTALMGNVNDEVRTADAEYARVLLSLLESEEAANRAKIRAEITPEYQRKREARDTKELCVELVRSLKYFLRSKTEEMRLAR